jgi:uncharacterized protein
MRLNWLEFDQLWLGEVCRFNQYLMLESINVWLESHRKRWPDTIQFKANCINLTCAYLLPVGRVDDQSMDQVVRRLRQIDWIHVAEQLHRDGYALVPDLLQKQHCDSLIDLYHSPTAFRKTVCMEQHRFGLGEYKYFDNPLPEIVQSLRLNLYSRLAPIANSWMHKLSVERQFPDHLPGLLEQCHANGQRKPTPLLLRYEAGGFNTLHQDMYGDVFFPLQAAFVLNEANSDFFGGEFVLTHQSPRAQAKVSVLTPGLGAMIIFTTRFRPAKSVRGYYRVAVKHGVSEVHAGIRYAMGIIFHDATK